MMHLMMLGEPILFARTKDGEAFALRDICPHRAMPLSQGCFDGEKVECCYHGWTFDKEGTCRDIPWLTGHEDVDPTKIKVRNYHVHEAQGSIWVFMGEKPSDIPENFAHKPPVIPGVSGPPGLWTSCVFDCHMDNAVIGLMDPAHATFVHQSWWWRSKKSIQPKAKAFGPFPFGFVMKRHSPSKNSFGYKILGGKPETEISFQLPGSRLEHIMVGKHHVVNLTVVTPVDENTTRLTNLIYWTQPWLNPLRVFFRPFMEQFIEQDRDIVERQQKGLRFEKSMLLLKDVDTLARWYFQLKNEYRDASGAGRAFSNPVPDVTLRWKT